ncbi:MAG: beta-lactamase family protein [Verrucomicrobiae bacterium]|nr:beta-lactamase family protein [Verrucomicrobiae bacterium]
MTALAKSGLALDAQRVAQVETLFRDYSQVNAPGVAVMVIREGKTIFAKGFGLADLQHKTPCTTNTNFRLASVTKQFTAMAVMMLVEKKKLMLDERLTNFFPEFPDPGNQISVRHLLTHTSGLLDYEDLIPPGTTIPVLDQDVLRLLVAAEARRRTDATTGDNRLLTSAATYFPPGTQYRYSNSGYALLALIVEVRSGQKFAQFLKVNIFDPLKMSNTLAYEEGYGAIPNRAYGHTQRTNGWQRTDQSLTSSVLGDGGVYSSLADLFKWDQALYTPKLVSEPMLRVAFSSATTTDKPGRSYGFGWYLGEYRGLKEVWHSGETIGFRTRIARFPQKKFTVIILANRADAKLEELPHKIADLLLFQ